MQIYVAYLFYLLIVPFFSVGFYKKNKRELLAFFLWLGTFLVMALRGKTIGNDLERYLYYYDNFYYFKYLGIEKEFGFNIFLKILKYFQVGDQGYILITSFIISFAFARFFLKYSKDIFFSFFLNFSIGLFAFSMSGIRQSLAISVILFSIDFLLKRKLLYFILLVYLAYTIHKSALFFAPAYFLLSSKKWKNGFILLSLLMGLSVIIFRKQFLVIFNYFIFDSYIGNYLEKERSIMNILPIVVNISLTLSVLYFWVNQNDSFSKQHISTKIFFIFSVIYSYLSILSLELSLIGRVGFYYYVGNFILIPNVLSKFKSNKVIYIYKFIIIVLCTIFFFLANNEGILKIDNYQFYWE